MKRTLSLAVLIGVLSLSTSPNAAWAVAQGNGDPIVARGYAAVFDAKRAALQDCNRLFSNCEIVHATQTGCLALASGSGKWGVGTGTKSASRTRALDACEATGAKQCKVVHDFCGR